MLCKYEGLILPIVTREESVMLFILTTGAKATKSSILDSKYIGFSEEPMNI